MTALGILRPGHSGEDDYPRIEQLLGSDVRVDLVHTGTGGDVPGGADFAGRLAPGVEELRLAGAETVVWAGAGFVHGWQEARRQVRTLARLAGMPASSTSLAFVHAARALGVRRVAVATAFPKERAALFADFLRAAGLEVTGVHSAGDAAVAGAGAGVRAGVWGEAWGEAGALAMVRAADGPGAQAVVVPDTALPTAAYLPVLEGALSKPVLTGNQVTVWEGLRLADRRVNAPSLGALFTRERPGRA
ncbi:decarboxylase [Streptomyces sp. TG1A-8]|uniref:maleate cis-trans isomerase family protein n=1 Tax=Streptomyces sp. TG1A-8 TaxID=3051385 RepID=UPI00265BB34B|nr:decarboxylase [Streptomyces sp. TG1A-8]MDO0927560.1 decarboxylase [Streptomyces sp. TG1A-8]